MNETVGRAWTPDQDFRSVELSVVTASVTAKASIASHRRRVKRAIPTAARVSAEPRPRPSQLKTSATSVKNGMRMSSIASDQRRSTGSGSAGTTSAMSTTTASSTVPSQNPREGRSRKRSGALRTHTTAQEWSISHPSLRLGSEPSGQCKAHSATSFRDRHGVIASSSPTAKSTHTKSVRPYLVRNLRPWK